MLRSLVLSLALAVFGAARAEEQAGPIVVELFTSQGCSACPPADRMLARLAEREDVLALALHVDYWDYIGWEDAFAHSDFTKRQKAYAHEAGERMIYTPQMVVQGVERVVGTRPAALLSAIGEHGEAGGVTMRAARHGDRVEVEALAAGAFDPPLDVVLVRYDPSRRADITHGENAGLSLDYANVVTGWERVAGWDGRAPLALELPAPGEDRAAILLQEPGPGPIHAAARAD